MPAPEPPLRVAYVTHVARLSGAEIGLLRLVEAARDRVDATVLLAEDGPLAPALRAAGAAVEVVSLAPVARDARRAEVRPGARQAVAAGHLAAYVPRLGRRLRALAPDLVHTNSLKAGVYGSLAARLARRPVIWHLHDHLTPEYLSPGSARVMRRLVTTLPDALAAPSRTALASVGARAARLPTATFPLPIPAPSRPAALRPELRTVGVVGRLTPWKGQHVFLEAFAAAFPGDGVRARVIGSAVFGEEDYARELERLAADLGIAKRVEFRGFRSDVSAELAELDLLVHSSVLPDPLATTVLEGMAAGVPTVSADAGGHAEYVAARGAGLLYPPGDAAALAAALRRAAEDGALRAELAARGRSLAAEFSPEPSVARIIAFYEEVLAARGRR